MKLYRDFSTQEEIDEQYNAGASIPISEREGHIERYIADSKAARENLECELDIPYGPTLDENLDVFPSATPGSPILLFIHGGYWRARSSKDFSFITSAFVAQGVTVVVNNYALCPEVSIAEITRQNRATVAWLAKHADAYNGDANKIYISGHSAGGHLTAMVCSTNWREQYGLDANLVKGGIPISGIFDLQPLRYSYLQPVLQISDELIRQQSPCYCIPDKGPPLIVSVGENESAEFHRQATEHHEAWRQQGGQSQLRVEAKDDHFSILYTLADENSSFFADIMRMLKA